MADHATIFYGPYRCECGEMICRVALEQGGKAFTYPDPPIYPNTPWKDHDCPHMKSSEQLVAEADALWAKGYSYRQIPRECCFAARDLGIEREWLHVPGKQ